MAYGIMLVKEVHANEIADCEKHNRRLYAPDKMPSNIKVDKIEQNFEWIDGDKPTFKQAIYDKLKGIKVRKNAVVALEFIVSASPEFFKNEYYSASGFLSECEKFLGRRYGWDNMVATNQHFDEQTPHVHILIVPIVEKTRRWKNRSGEGETNKERRLCARDLTGDRFKLRQLQDDFHKFIIPYGKIAQVEFVRGTPVEEQTRVYTERTDHRLSRMNELEERAKQEIDIAKRILLNEQILKEAQALKKDKEEKEKIEREARLKSQNMKRGYRRGF
jgi:hypothetical protein